MENEFRDKAYLASYVLDTRLFDKFDFLASDAAPIRSVYILTTDQGYKILKKLHYGVDEIDFLYRVINTIKQEYPYLINFRKNSIGEPYTVYNNEIYGVFDLVEGRECMFENPIDLKMVALGLSEYHRACEKVTLPFNKKRNSLGKLPAKYRKCIRELEYYKKIAKLHVNKSEFDSIYLDYCDYYITCIQEAIKQIEGSSYLEACKTSKILCHHDLAHHNIILGNDNKVYFLDFDYAIYDLAYHDLSNFITKAAKKNNWDNNSLNIIIDAYSSISPITDGDKEILLGYLRFPIDFYDISKAYFTKTKAWEEEDFIERIRRKAGFKEPRAGLIEYFNSIPMPRSCISSSS